MKALHKYCKKRQMHKTLLRFIPDLKFEKPLNGSLFQFPKPWEMPLHWKPNLNKLRQKVVTSNGGTCTKAPRNVSLWGYLWESPAYEQIQILMYIFLQKWRHWYISSSKTKTRPFLKMPSPNTWRELLFPEKPGGNPKRWEMPGVLLPFPLALGQAGIAVLLPWHWQEHSSQPFQDAETLWEQRINALGMFAPSPGAAQRDSAVQLLQENYQMMLNAH